MMILKKMTKTTLVLTFALGLTACVSQSGEQKNKTATTVNMMNARDAKAFLAETELKEKLYVSTKAYGKLVDLYRQVLKVLPEKDKDMRNLYLYKLSQAYFDKGDNKSSLLYVASLLNEPHYKQRAMSLQLKALIQEGEFKDALTVANQLIALYPHMADTYNSQGIAYAQLGQFSQAQASFNKARSYFMDDLVAINNLAMLDIIQGQYKNAVRLLLPQYLNHKKDQRLVYNLVFALIKSGDEAYAVQIIEENNLSTNPTTLVNALKRTQRLSRQITSRH